MNDLPRFCRDCANRKNLHSCCAEETLVFADLVTGDLPLCREMRRDISASRCGAEGRWFKPKEAHDAPVH